MNSKAPTLIRSISITPVDRGGRPKDEPRQAAIALASRYAQNLEGGAAAGRRLLTARARDARFPFALSNERNVRRVETDPRNPINRLPVPAVPVYLRLDDSRGSCAVIGAANYTLSADEMQIVGTGWLWIAGEQRAVYGHVTAVADLRPAHEHRLAVTS